MCGIAGIIQFDNQHAKESELRLMMLAMKHRGPDDEGVFLSESTGLGFVRLSIIDLSPAGHQPMQDETSRFTIIFNGEIYNYVELRNELLLKGIKFNSDSDTEVLLKTYIHYGKDCLHKLNGMFAFVIYDAITCTLFAARDRFGVKPFYYTTVNNRLVFASEIPALLSVYGMPNEANMSAVYDYLMYNRTDQTDETFFNHIVKLQHGHYLEVKNNSVRVEKWYDLEQQISPIDTDVLHYKSLLIDAVRLRLRSDVPVGVCLSGGLDSSVITSIIAGELNFPKVHTFSAVYQPGHQSDESKFINLFNPMLENMHRVTPTAELLFQQLDHFVSLHAEPIPSTSPFAQYCVMQLAKKNVTVTLDGQGADEQLAGYHYFFGFYFKDLLLSGSLIRLSKEIYHYIRIHKSLYGLITLIYFLLPVGWKRKTGEKKLGYLHSDFIKISNENMPSRIVNDLYSSKSLHQALLNHFEFKLEHLLKWNDRNSMAFSVESRTPFLDYRLVEYTLSSTSQNKISKGVTKHLLRKAMKGIVPEGILNRQDKVGFATPQADWFREEPLVGYVTEILNSESFINRKIINPSVAKEMFNRHLNKESDLSKEIWKWLHLELWFRKFID